MTRLTTDRPIYMTLTVEEAMVIQAAIYNGQLAGKLKTHSGLTPSRTAELAADLFDRIKWLLNDEFNTADAERYDP
jgi:hypothetical protein